MALQKPNSEKIKMENSERERQREEEQYAQFLEQDVLITDDIEEAHARRYTTARLCRAKRLIGEHANWYLPLTRDEKPSQHTCIIDAHPVTVFGRLRETRKDYFPTEGNINPEGLIFLVDGRKIKDSAR